MSRNRLRFVTTCGLAVGLFFVGQGGRAEDCNSAPGKVAGAAGAVADQQKPATFLRAMGVSPAANYEKSGPSPAGPGAAGGRPAAGAAPSAEPLMVLKSGPEHKRLVYHVKAVPVSDLERTVSQLFHLEGELHPLGGATGTGASASRVAIAASKTGNSLVVSGPPDAVEEVWTLLEKLDQLHGLVLLEMEIGEVAGRRDKARWNSGAWKRAIGRRNGRNISFACEAGKNGNDRPCPPGRHRQPARLRADGISRSSHHEHGERSGKYDCPGKRRTDSRRHAAHHAGRDNCDGTRCGAIPVGA